MENETEKLDKEFARLKLNKDSDIWLLEKYLNKSLDVIYKEYCDNRFGEDRNKQNFLYKATKEELVTEYYKITDKYLYELMAWEQSLEKQANFKNISLFCKKFKIKKVLDYGGGIGGLCLYLNNKSIHCDYLDVPGKTFDFAKYRFKKSGFDILMFDALSGNVPDNSYDAVTAYDVFEHIFDLKNVLIKINNLLIKNGFLISKPTFSGGGIHLAKNEIYQDFNKFDNLLKETGFELVGQLKSGHVSRFLNLFKINYCPDILIKKRNKFGGNFIIHRKI